MAKINGIENMSGVELSAELAKGGRFVVYRYAISIIVMTFYRSSNVTFVKAEENGLVKGLGFTFLTLFLGWWGFPWGPVRSIQALIANLKGGEDVTDRVVSAMKQASRVTIETK